MTASSPRSALTSRPAPLPWQWLGRIAHGPAIALQEHLRARLLAGEREARRLLLCEHEPVITLGLRADRAHLLATEAALAGQGIAVVQTRRGGDITYHGPGQLMIYPAVRLRGRLTDFLETLATALAEFAATLGVPGAVWRREPAGLWLPDPGPEAELPQAKLAACGVHLRRGAILHGFAFNVATPAAAWRAIVPCGLRLPVTSIADERARRGLSPPPPVAEVAHLAGPHLAQRLAEVLT
ncbi:lipoyl(octanoyl) transferase LipB [Haliangium sp.]|uniref:lipoyl(octanoyl) transferase LipB n=1 Tax=Haliangium sp. TaxID=2663208 RepID=UPI003D0C98DA